MSVNKKIGNTRFCSKTNVIILMVKNAFKFNKK